MDKPIHPDVNIRQTPIEDLAAGEGQAADVKGGVIRSGNTYTGTTEIREGVLN